MQNVKSYLRPFNSSDISVVREVYRDSVQSLSLDIYSQEQINAWSSLSSLPGILDRPFDEGRGWVSCKGKQVEAFALRYPRNRLALLYCRGRSFRQGRSTSLVKCIQLEAQKEGQTCLFTEASLCSYPLLLRLGWKIIKPEEITIGGVYFQRMLMKREFKY